MSFISFLSSFVKNGGQAVGEKAALVSLNLFPEITKQSDLDAHLALCNKISEDVKAFQKDVQELSASLKQTTSDLATYQNAGRELLSRLDEAQKANDTARVSSLNSEITKASVKIEALKAREASQSSQLAKLTEALNARQEDFDQAIQYHNEMAEKYRDLSATQRANAAEEARNKRVQSALNGKGEGRNSSILDAATRTVEKETTRLEARRATSDALKASQQPSGELADIIKTSQGAASNPADRLRGLL